MFFLSYIKSKICLLNLEAGLYCILGIAASKISYFEEVPFEKNISRFSMNKVEKMSLIFPEIFQKKTKFQGFPGFPGSVCLNPAKFKSIIHQVVSSGQSKKKYLFRVFIFLKFKKFFLLNCSEADSRMI